jgi:hypothetical protein
MAMRDEKFLIGAQKFQRQIKLAFAQNKGHTFA